MELLDLQLLQWMAEVGRWSVEGLWLPLLAWTAIALPAFLIIRFTEAGSPHVRYWSLVALLLALPIGVAAAAVALFDTSSMEAVAIVTLPATIIVTAPATAATFTWTAWHTAGAALVTAWLVALWRGGTLTLGLLELRALRRSTEDTPRWIVDETVWTAYKLGIEERVSVVVASTPSPFTVGWLNPLIVLPRDLVESPQDLRFALTHELIHIRRNDYSLQFVEQIIGAVFYFHPLVTLIRREAADLREITCDADVVSNIGERSAYARVLCRYSTGSAGERMFAVGIFSREHQLHKRIRAMQSFLSEHGLNRSKQHGVAIFGTLLCLAVVAVACSDALVNSGPGSDGTENASVADSSEDLTFVVVEEMPELIGGLKSIQENLRYPELARKAGVEGRVIVQFVVDEEGNVVDPQIVRGIGSGLDEAALAAVRTARFEPGMQRGVPVKVKMSLPVTFALSPSGDGTSASVIRLLVNANDQLLVGDTPASLSTLVPELERRGVTSETVVTLRVDADASTEIVQQIQNILRGTDVRRIEYGVNVSDPSPVRGSLRIEDLRREDRTIRGRVVDPTGMAVPGVNIALVGEKVGAVTNSSGEFWFSLPEDVELSGAVQASHVSYAAAREEFR